MRAATPASGRPRPANAESVPPSNRRPELLAPAGGPDAGRAALLYGADAIYLGLKSLSARADAENFDPDQLEDITALAHDLRPRRRVFAAVNTVILDREIPDLIRALALLEDAGADGVIVQDLGAARIAHRHFPGLRLHASTQLAIHNRAGAEALRRLGFVRATLARELTLDEIRDAAATPDLETEVFLHGALCFAYSGVCLFSSHSVGRSGNRGRCAYLCRDAYSRVGEPGRAGEPRFPFSMKDLSLADDLAALCEAGVASLKIEGRKKSALYVAAVTDFYRRMIDGRLSAASRSELESDIQTVFSRPWTRFFIRSRTEADVTDRETVGHRGALIGRVERVVRDGASRFVRFRSARRLERYDGLQIDLPGQPRPFGFSIRSLRTAGGGRRADAIESPAGAVVDVRLPPGHPPIPVGAAVYCSSSQAVKKRYASAAVAGGQAAHRAMTVTVDLTPERAVIRAEAPAPAGPPVEASETLAGPFEPALRPERTTEAFRAAFGKLGNTRLALGDLRVHNPSGAFVPVSRINAVRRTLVAALESGLAERRETRARDVAAVEAAASAVPISTAPAAGVDGERWTFCCDDPECLAALEPADWADVHEVVLILGRTALPDLRRVLREQVPAGALDRVRFALPVLTRAWETAELNRHIRALRADGRRKWMAANPSAWTFLDAWEDRSLDLVADWPLYVLNRSAAAQLLEMGARQFTLSPEDGFDNMRDVLRAFPDRATVIVYQDTPLFLAEDNEPLRGGPRAPDGLARSDAPLLRSSRGFEILTLRRGGRITVVARRPFCLASRLGVLRRAGARSFRVDFLHRHYIPAAARAIWRSVRHGKAPGDTHPGNFDRGLA